MNTIRFLIAMATLAAPLVQSNVLENGFHDHEQMTSLLKSLALKYPHYAKLYSVDKSVEGRDLWVLQISENVHKRKLLEPKFKYVANMHGDESLGREMVIQLAAYLLENYNSSARIKHLIDNTDIHLLPCVNPDGFFRAVEGDCGNKTGRMNANGVDLNRNFPNTFDPHKRTTFAKETVSLMKWITGGTQFVLSANFQGGAVVTKYPYDSRTLNNDKEYNATPDDELFISLAKTYAYNHPDMKTGAMCDEVYNLGGIVNGAEWYDVSGGMQDYNYVYSNCFEITVMNSCCKYPSGLNLTHHWNNNQESLVAFMERVHTGIKGVVKDSDGKPVIGAKIYIDSNPKWVHTSDRGEFWRLALPGRYVLTVKSPHGRQLLSKNVFVADGNKGATNVRAMVESTANPDAVGKKTTCFYGSVVALSIYYFLYE